MKTIKIGRSSTNDVIINNVLISSQHAIITVLDEGSVMIKDLNSKNGTFVNNRQITNESRLVAGDKVRLGDQVINWEQIVQKYEKIRTVPHHSATVIPSDIKEQKTIGRSSSAQLRYNYDDVSGQHAVLYQKTNGDIVIIDNNSTNGTYVNGNKIISQVLKKGDVVLISKKYPLAWENVFKTNKFLIPKPLLYGTGAAVAIIIVLLFFVFGRRMTEKEIYEKYNSSVCLVYFQYGYRVKLEGQDKDENIHQLLGIEKTACVIWNADSGRVEIGKKSGSGTGFFISEDGKIATNLHVVSPWLYEKGAERIAQIVRNILKVKALKENPLYDTYVSQVRVEGKLLSIGIVPNGLPFAGSNYSECNVYKVADDVNKDVAVIQTVTHGLPQKVNNIIDIRKAVTDDKAIRQGGKVYTIGFPYGIEIAETSTGLQNQIQSGIITQERGEFEFGHNASTAGGASGSPILDQQGHLIGVHHAGMTGVTGAQGFNRAIKAKYVCELAK